MYDALGTTRLIIGTQQAYNQASPKGVGETVINGRH